MRGETRLEIGSSIEKRKMRLRGGDEISYNYSMINIIDFNFKHHESPKQAFLILNSSLDKKELVLHAESKVDLINRYLEG
jgi:hypothetical protein